MKTDRDPLNLGSLPLLEPLADGWPEIQAALQSPPRKPRQWKTAAVSLAVAASLTLVVGLVLMPNQNEPGLQKSDATPVLAQDSAESESADQAVTALIGLSQRLESSVRLMRSDAPFMPTSSVVYQVELEDMVAQVDEALSRNPESTDLWRQRVGLLLDLTRLYRNELRRENAQMASL